MTHESINIAIAECLGWTPSPDGRWTQHSSGIVGPFYHELPNWHGSLDACAEMEALLDNEERAYYVSELAGICGQFPECNPFNEAKFTTFATASQRCEAFLKVKGKWIEEKGARE